MHDLIDFYCNKIELFDGEKIIEKFYKNYSNKYEDSFCLTLRELKILDSCLDKKYKNFLKNKRTIYLYLNYPTEIDYDTFCCLNSNYNFYCIISNGFSVSKVDKYETQTKSIEPWIFALYLKKIKEFTKDLSLRTDDFESDIRTISILSNRICENILYDHSSNIKSKKIKSKYYNTPNEIIGIIDSKAVCRGYSGIFKDCLKILNFDSNILFGNNKKENISGHAWNQVKVCDKWYNCDLTWDKSLIINKKTPLFLLSDDNFFYGAIVVEADKHSSHSDYGIPDYLTNHTCDESVERSIIEKYIFEEEIKKENWLKNLFKNKNNKGVVR